MVKTLFFAALFTLACLPSQAGDVPQDGQVSLRIDEAGAIRVAVTIDGSTPFTFLLDTGANRSSVSSEVAARLHLPTVAKASMVTSTGAETQPIVRLDTMRIGTTEKAGLLASVVSSARLRAAVYGIDGIVGQDFLSSFNYTLDYRHRRLTWTAETPGREAGAECRLRLVRDEGRFLVELPQAERTVWFVPDSGADVFVVFERNGALPVALDESGRRSTLATVTGSENLRPMVLRYLQVGRAAMKNEPAFVVERNEPDAPKGDGLLPLHRFASVSFDSADGFLTLRP